MVFESISRFHSSSRGLPAERCRPSGHGRRSRTSYPRHRSIPDENRMSASYHVRVAKEQLTFSAAHFITLQNGSLCERLHGHNYRVAVEVSGPLDASQCVIDFIAVRDLLATLTVLLDHHVLLPTNSPH